MLVVLRENSPKSSRTMLLLKTAGQPFFKKNLSQKVFLLEYNFFSVSSKACGIQLL